MADIGKKGYSYTGYSEPFIVPTGQTVTAALLSGQNWGITGINGAVPIEYTEFVNSGLYVRPDVTGSGTSFTSKDLNIDTRMAVGAGKWIITDDGGTTYIIIDSITYNGVVYDGTNDSEKGVYTVTCSASVTTVAGKALRVVARQLDLGDAVATTTYAAGERVTLPVTTTP